MNPSVLIRDWSSKIYNFDGQIVIHVFDIFLCHVIFVLLANSNGFSGNS